MTFLLELQPVIQNLEALLILCTHRIQEFLLVRLYSTIGGRKKYIDLAMSYADAKTDCNDTFNTTSYDVNSSMESFYIGSGYSLVSP